MELGVLLLTVPYYCTNTTGMTHIRALNIILSWQVQNRDTIL